MEQQPRSDRYLAPSLARTEEWEKVLTDGELTRRFDELVDWTMTTADPRTGAWVKNRQEVAGRWQHAIEVLEEVAQIHSFPLMRHGHGWGDKAYTEEVLAPIDFRSFDAPRIENGLILAHHLAVQKGSVAKKGVALKFNIANTKDSAENPRYNSINNVVVDLRDMGEPTDTVLGDMTFEAFRGLDEAAREAIADQLNAKMKTLKQYGKNYGWTSPPQQERFYTETRTYSEYCKQLEYGTTDDNEIDRINDQRKADEIARLRAERPDFGKLPESYAGLPKNVRQCIGAMFEYFDQMRDRFDEITIDTYSMSEMEFTDDELAALREAGVLESVGSYVSPAGVLWNFKLAQPWYERWVSRHYPSPKQSRSDT